MFGFLKKLLGGEEEGNAETPLAPVSDGKSYLCPNCGYTSNQPGGCPNCGVPLREEGQSAF